MRQTSLRRAPQRLIIDRTLGDSGAPATPGACSVCHRVVSVTKTGRRRLHRDQAGDHCVGSGVFVEAHPVVLDELPPVNVPPRSGVRGDAQPPVLAADGYAVPYTGGSDRETEHGRGECGGCGRHLPLNSDGSLRRHRVRHLDPFAPHCTQGRQS